MKSLPEVTFLGRVSKVVLGVTLPEDYSILANRDSVFQNPKGLGRVYIQIVKWRRDVLTGEMGDGPGAKVYLSRHMTETEVVHAIWGAYQGHILHEARETFQYLGKRVFGPHIDINAMLEVADRLDVR